MQDTDPDRAPAPNPAPPSDRIAQIVSAFAQRPDTSVDDIVELAAKLTERLDPPAPGALATTDIAPAATAIAPVAPAAPVARPIPAVPIETSVGEDRITCLCCGARFQTLKRHLKAAHGLTEDAYRTMFGLPDDYPTVAPSYSRRRARVALDNEFGKHDRDAGNRTREIV